MQITWGTTVWALNGTEEPARPWNITYDERGWTKTSPSGYSTSKTFYSKVVIAWSWPSATQAIDGYIRDIIEYGLFTLECDLGTYNMVLMPETYTCTVSGYGAFTLSVTAAEV